MQDIAAEWLAYWQVVSHPSRHSGAPVAQTRNPSYGSLSGEMDSGLAPRGAPRNDSEMSCTALLCSFFQLSRYNPIHSPDASSFNRATASARRVNTARWLM